MLRHFKLIAAAVCAGLLLASAASATLVQIDPAHPDPNNLAFQGAVAMTVGTTYTPQRSIGAICTVAGNMAVTFPDASVLVVPVQVGFQTFPFAVTAVNTSGTNAICAYVNLK